MFPGRRRPARPARHGDQRQGGFRAWPLQPSRLRLTRTTPAATAVTWTVSGSPSLARPAKVTRPGPAEVTRADVSAAGDRGLARPGRQVAHLLLALDQ